MSETHGKPDPSPQGYENIHIHAKPVLIGLAGLLALIIVGSGGAMLVYKLLGHPAPPPPPIAGEFHKPLIQVDPARDLKRLHAQEDRLLGSYGWVDRAHGVVHIPIDQAMELVLKRGLPTRRGASASAP